MTIDLTILHQFTKRMAKATVISSLFFAYYRRFLHVTGGELALVAQMREEHAQHEVDDRLYR